MSMKEAYEKKLQARMDQWNAEIKSMKAKADGAEADAELKYYKEIEKLREQQQDAQSKLNELRHASEDSWEDLKAGLENAWDEIDTALQSAVSRFR